MAGAGRDRLPFQSVVCLVMAVLFLGGWATGGCSEPETHVAGSELARDVRPPAAAGTFYPGTERKLRRTVEELLEAASPRVPTALRELRPRALIVPHAGYTYSGATAAFAYKLLEGKPRPERVILVGPAHYVGVSEVLSVPPFTHYRTPLGDIPVDTTARQELLEADIFRMRRPPHGPEHSLEVQLPFLQVLWDEPPKILPVLCGSLTLSQCRSAAAAIERVLGEDGLLLVSTDFTHYGPRFGYQPFAGAAGDELARKIEGLDRGATRYIAEFSPEGFLEYVADTGATICGRIPVTIMLALFSGEPNVQAADLHYTTSGELTGDYGNSVSYFAIAVYRERKGEPPQRTAPPVKPDGDGYTEHDKRTMLELARRAISHYLAEDEEIEVKAPDYPERLRQECGVFVTLEKNGQLRGCIGSVIATAPLVELIPTVAVKSAVRDRRFRPLEAAELDEVQIEISILTPLRKVRDAGEIQVGRDGLVIVKGNRSGLLLPQVASRYGWDTITFLEQTCSKAGLPIHAWGEADIYRFSATVFSESELEQQPSPAAD